MKKFYVTYCYGDDYGNWRNGFAYGNDYFSAIDNFRRDAVSVDPSCKGVFFK